MSQEKVYLKIDRSIVVKDRNVRLEDVATITGTNPSLLRELKQMKIYTFVSEDVKNRSAQKEKEQHGQVVVFSILKIIELIQKKHPNVDVSNEGEMDFVVEYVCSKPEKWIQNMKVVVLSAIIFFGAAFTIMAFNNDIGITEVFSKFYEQVMGTSKEGVTELEISYSIGLALGITIFFNHFGKKKITKDPTPLQIQMRKYADDIDNVLIENAGRKGHNIDVD